MYATIGEYLGGSLPPISRMQRENYVLHSSHSSGPVRETFNVNSPTFTPNEQIIVSPVPTQKIQPLIPKSPINMEWESKKIKSTADPSVWGPAFWFSLHNSAAHYPIDASPIVRERMKNRILSIPYEIPCRSCLTHASAFIESKRSQLDTIVSGRHQLGKFYVEFHNKVNQRYNKRQWTYEEAYAIYSGNANVSVLKYT